MATNASTHASPVTPAEIDYLLRMLQNEDAESMRSKALQRPIDGGTTEEAPSTRTDRTCVKPLALRLIGKMVVHSIETTTNNTAETSTTATTTTTPDTNATNACVVSSAISITADQRCYVQLIMDSDRFRFNHVTVGDVFSFETVGGDNDRNSKSPLVVHLYYLASQATPLPLPLPFSSPSFFFSSNGTIFGRRLDCRCGRALTFHADVASFHADVASFTADLFLCPIHLYYLLSQ